MLTLKKLREIQTEPAQKIFESDEVGSLVASGFDFEYETCANEFYIEKHTPSGVLVLSPRPKSDQLHIVYPGDYEPYRFEDFGWLISSARKFVQASKVKALKALLPKDARVLDLGCGNGSLLRLISSYKDIDWELHANDINLPSLQQLKEEGIHTHEYPCEKIELNNYFDAIILNQVIEHFADPKGVLRHCKRLLKEGGILFIETPCTEGVDAKFFSKHSWGGYHFPRHFYLFNEKNLSVLLVEVGFSVSGASYLVSPAFWTQSLHHFFYRKGYRRLSKLFHLKNIPLTIAVVLLDKLFLLLNVKTSNMRVVAKK